MSAYLLSISESNSLFNSMSSHNSYLIGVESDYPKPQVTPLPDVNYFPRISDITTHFVQFKSQPASIEWLF